LLFDNRALDPNVANNSGTASRLAIEPPVFERLVYLVQNRNRGANNDNLIASAAPITNAAETTSAPIWSESFLTLAPRQITRFPSMLLGPSSSCLRVKVCSPEQTSNAIGVCYVVEGREHACGQIAGGSAIA
jgi:hypothetical protein